MSAITKEKYCVKSTSGQKISGAARSFGGEDDHVSITMQFRIIDRPPL